MEELTTIEKITIQVTLKKRLDELRVLRKDAEGLLVEVVDSQIDELIGILKKCAF
tara:strand:- start:5065 stop:5229 length:165 start_codon:yes stop_codon:yes gene_type:complete